MRLVELKGQRVAIWGWGREGAGAWKAIRNASPTQLIDILCSPDDGADPAQLDARTRVLSEIPGYDVLGKYDVVVKSPGISLYHPAIERAAKAGVRFTSGSAIWFAENPDARVIAITGTKGKSTTSALAAHLLRHAGLTVALCGNIGLPLLDLLQPDRRPDWWVVELSSFQTSDMNATPDIAAVLNLFPEHLDWHRDLQTYYADKMKILGDGTRLQVLHPQLRDAHAIDENARIRWFDLAPTGFYVRDGDVWLENRRILQSAQLPLIGKHNAGNLCAALTVLQAAEADWEKALQGLACFKPLPHRLQILGENDGLRFVNDSISTTPHATMAAMAHFGAGPLAVLVGGFDRGVSWEGFAESLQAHPQAHIVATGQSGPRILAALQAHKHPHLHASPSLAEAVALAREITPRDGTVLLSPGAPSFGEFKDYIERGKRFAQLAGFDPGAITAIEGLGVA